MFLQVDMLLNQRVLTEGSRATFPERRAISKRELIQDILF